MSIFSDRRSLRQIGGLKAYLRQVSWSLRWQLGWRRRVRRTLARPISEPALYASRRRAGRPGTPVVGQVAKAPAHRRRATGSH